MVDCPLFPSLVAVIVADPAATPATSPPVLTVATDVLLLAQATARPESALPPASIGVAVNCVVWPVWMLAVAGVTATDATGTGAAATVTVALPLWPSLVAVIAAEPTVAAVTSPLGLTVATVVLPLAQVTVLPGSGLPLASFGVAVSCTVAPTATDADAGVTSTTATGMLVTVIADVALWPPLVAVIVAKPGTAPPTRPLPFTGATVPLLLVHVTVWPDIGVPLVSMTVAASC